MFPKPIHPHHQDQWSDVGLVRERRYQVMILVGQKWITEMDHFDYFHQNAMCYDNDRWLYCYRYHLNPLVMYLGMAPWYWVCGWGRRVGGCGDHDDHPHHHCHYHYHQTHR